MKIAQFIENGRVRLGLIQADGMTPLVFAGDMIDFISGDWATYTLNGKTYTLDQVRLAPPVTRPAKIIGIGLELPGPRRGAECKDPRRTEDLRQVRHHADRPQRSDHLGEGRHRPGGFRSGTGRRHREDRQELPGKRGAESGIRVHLRQRRERDGTSNSRAASSSGASRRTPSARSAPGS